MQQSHPVFVLVSDANDDPHVYVMPARTESPKYYHCCDAFPVVLGPSIENGQGDSNALAEQIERNGLIRLGIYQLPVEPGKRMEVSLFDLGEVVRKVLVAHRRRSLAPEILPTIFGADIDESVALSQEIIAAVIELYGPSVVGGHVIMQDNSVQSLDQVRPGSRWDSSLSVLAAPGAGDGNLAW